MTPRAARPCYREALAAMAVTESLWRERARLAGDAAGMRFHERAVIRLANTLMLTAAAAQHH